MNFNDYNNVFNNNKYIARRFKLKKMYIKQF